MSSHLKGLSEPVYEVDLQRDSLTIPMRDGTKLVADLYLPKGEGPWPVLLERTPYDKGASPEVGVKSPQFFVSRGYAVVIQDTRGRFKSEGEWYPFRDDGWGLNRDGFDTVEWIAHQAWCNGRIGTIGGSYSGHTQYAIAATNPPNLTCQFIRESVCDYRDGWVMRGGALELAFVMRWALLMTHTGLPRLAPHQDLQRLDSVLKKAQEELLDSWVRCLPLRSFPLVKGLSDWFYDLLDHPEDGPYWWEWNLAPRHIEVGKPIYHLGGWFDQFLGGAIDNYLGILKETRSEHARKNQKLIIGPWVHGPGSTSQRKTGEFDFGPDAALDFNEVRLPWFDYWLRDIDTGIMNDPPVRFFTMGINRWQAAETWPPRGIQFSNFYFQDGNSGSAVSLNDGRLGGEVPVGAGGADSYLYDPNDPVPTLGGSWIMPDKAGPYDQRPVERRCLTYSSEPLNNNVEVTGPVTTTLFAMSSAEDTDWVVRLSDVSPDGVSRPLADGILRARYYESQKYPKRLTPNQVYPFHIDLWSTSNVFLAGHRIRVTVTSSCFPRWDRNMNTGGSVYDDVDGKVATNTIFRDIHHPSHIILPLQPETLGSH